MKRITFNQLINFMLFFYVLSLYLFTFQPGWNVLSNFLALCLIVLIWLEILMLRKKIIFNYFAFVYLLFIIVCMVSGFYAINPIASVGKFQTLILIYILMLSLINYVDTFEKLDFIIKCFVYSGFITSVYILINADFTTLTRFGSELGNVNAIGMIIGISTIFSLYCFLKAKNYWYSLMILTNLIVILLTGSRKALLFTAIAIVIMLIFQENLKLRSKLSALFAGIVFIVVMFYAIFNVPIFYEIIGKRMVVMFALLTGESTSEGSINTRLDMILWGWTWIKDQPFLGYGIDNFRYLYGAGSSSGMVTYSHNNIIELLVGTGIIGTVLFYLANLIVIKDLLKASKLISKTVCYSFIVIIAGYIFISVGMVYYYDKDISIILAVGSIVYQLAKNESLR